MQIFIDSENVGEKWLNFLDIVSATDKLIVFYTQKSPHMSYDGVIKLKKSNADIEFIECEQGANALDFQLVTELGYRLSLDNDNNSYAIFSYDNGFRVVVNYWKKRGKEIKLLGKNDFNLLFSNKHNTLNPSTEIHPVPEMIVDDLLEEINSAKVEEYPFVLTVDDFDFEPDAKNNSIDNTTDSSTDTITIKSIDDKEISKEILFIIGKTNPDLLKSTLDLFFSQEKSSAFYKDFIRKGAYTNIIKKHVYTKEIKLEKFFELIVQTEQLPLPTNITEKALSYWNSSNNNLNSFKAKLVKEYSKDTGELYYKILKKYIRVIAKIK